MVRLNNIKNIERYSAYITAHVQPLVAIGSFSSTTTPPFLHDTWSLNTTSVMLKPGSVIVHSYRMMHGWLGGSSWKRPNSGL